MKLLRYGPLGQERPGLLDGEGRIRDLSGLVADIGPEQPSPAELARLATADLQALPLVAGAPRLGVPLARIGKIVAIGLNYVDHAAEANPPIPKEPAVFLKATSSLSGPNDPVVLPKDSVRGDWEVELQVDGGPWEQAERCYDGDGTPQIATPSQPEPDGATGLDSRSKTL